MKYTFIRAHQTEFHVRAMSRVLRVHFSGFYVPLGYDVKDRKGLSDECESISVELAAET